MRFHVEPSYGRYTITVYGDHGRVIFICGRRTIGEVCSFIGNFDANRREAVGVWTI